MLTERELQISPIVLESVQHNTKVRLVMDFLMIPSPSYAMWPFHVAARTLHCVSPALAIAADPISSHGGISAACSAFLTHHFPFTHPYTCSPLTMSSVTDMLFSP